jgi:hypothetical protein
MHLADLLDVDLARDDASELVQLVAHGPSADLDVPLDLVQLG